MKQIITKEEKSKKLEEIENDRISLYYLKQSDKEISKGNENIRVLYDLLVKEIIWHNGKVNKKFNKVKSLPTSD